MRDWSITFFFWAVLLLGTHNVVAAQKCWRTTPCTGPEAASFPGPWEQNIFAPASRSVKPRHLLHKDMSKVAFTEPLKFAANGSQVVLDFGIEVGGILSFSYRGTGPGQVGMAFSESRLYVGENSDNSNGGPTGDGALYLNLAAAGSGTYQMPDAKLRGGFRYATLFLVTGQNATVELSDVKLEIGFQPTWSNLRAYSGYFHSSDSMLNKVWYSGAYTLQTNAVPVAFGRHVPFVNNTWLNDGLLGPGNTIIVDGAKRDRAVWPGDMGIAVPSSFVSVNDLESVKNALQTMYDHQNKDGSFPEAGPPLLQQGSDTYHMWTMIGTYNYLLFSNDTDFLNLNWAKYLHAMDYIYGKVDKTGLLQATGTRDWARLATGFNNTEANTILYKTLQTGASLADWVSNGSTLSNTYEQRAADLKTAINKLCWDSEYGAFKDNATATKLHPQDANSMAVLFGIADSPRAETVSQRLTANWTPIGAVTPELPENISPFISSFEIQAHFSIGQTLRALDLIRRCWGWYLNNPDGTESTVVEGYLRNGTFGYRFNRGYNGPSYTSHSHGWSAGPTFALTSYVLGLSVTGRVGERWSMAPQFGDLQWAEGGFTTSLGKFEASWKKAEWGYSVTINTPVGTKGVISLPGVDGSGRSACLDGRAKREVIGAQGLQMEVSGGNHTVVVS